MVTLRYYIRVANVVAMWLVGSPVLLLAVALSLPGVLWRGELRAWGRDAVATFCRDLPRRPIVAARAREPGREASDG